MKRLYNHILVCVIASLLIVSFGNLASAAADDDLPDYSELSISTLQDMAKSGDSHASFSLGYNLLFDDDGTERSGTVDIEDAMVHLQAAHDAGHPYANTILSMIYNGGFGQAVNEQMFEKVVREAADRGSNVAKANYSIQLLDSEKAVLSVRAFGYLNSIIDETFYQNTTYPLLVETLYLGKQHIDADYIRARKSALQCVKILPENAFCHFILARDYKYGWGGDVDPIQSASHFLSSAKLGDERAMWSTGMNFLSGSGGLEVDESKAFEWVKESADRQYLQGQLSLAVMYALGQGTDVDFDKSFSTYELAANRGSFHAIRGLAAMHCYGQGRPVDTNLCLAGLILAAENKEQNAIILLQDGFKLHTSEEMDQAKLNTLNERKVWIDRYTLPISEY